MTYHSLPTVSHLAQKNITASAGVFDFIFFFILTSILVVLLGLTW